MVKNSVKVYVDNELWNPTADITKAGKNDKVYQLDVKTGFFKFGDGEHGAIPEKGKQVTVDYKVERDGFIDISKAMRETQKQINEVSDSQDEINIYTSWEADNFVDNIRRRTPTPCTTASAVHRIQQGWQPRQQRQHGHRRKQNAVVPRRHALGRWRCQQR